MSTVRTAIVPSFGGGGGGGKRDREGDDGRDRRRPDKPKPLDKIGASDFGPTGLVRLLILQLLQMANLGDLPSKSLLTRGGQPKTLDERVTAVQTWVNGLMGAAYAIKQARFSELAEAFVYVLQAVNRAGLFDQLVAMLVELLTNRAVERSEGE